MIDSDILSVTTLKRLGICENGLHLRHKNVTKNVTNCLLCLEEEMNTKLFLPKEMKVVIRIRIKHSISLEFGSLS